VKRHVLGLALASLLLLPACNDKKEDPNLPEMIAAKLDEADAKLREHQDDEAEVGYKWVLENEPDNVRALTGLGRIELLERQNPAGAIDPLEKAIAAGGDDAKAHAALGRAYAGTKKWDEAAEHLGKAWELDENTEQYALEYGVALRESGKLDEAAQMLEEVAQLNPKIKFVYRELGKTQQAAGELDKALRTFMKAQSAWQGDQDSYAGAAEVYEAQGEISKAVDQWSFYIQQDCCSTYSKEVAKPKLAELKEKENALPNDADG